MPSDPRGERLQIMLTKDELTAVDSWRFNKHMPSRAAAVRELLRRGLSAEGFAVANGSTKSGDFRVVTNGAAKPGKAQRNV
jgi:metal-responsive CopG/Arc/MetJ family transcriptional regulator